MDTCSAFRAGERSLSALPAVDQSVTSVLGPWSKWLKRFPNDASTQQKGVQLDQHFGTSSVTKRPVNSGPVPAYTRRRGASGRAHWMTWAHMSSCRTVTCLCYVDRRSGSSLQTSTRPAATGGPCSRASTRTSCWCSRNGRSAATSCSLC